MYVNNWSARRILEGEILNNEYSMVIYYLALVVALLATRLCATCTVED